MTQQLWSYDIAEFPLPSLLDNATPVIQLGDPVLYAICQFFLQVLNGNLLPRFANEAVACGLTSSNFNNWTDGYAVAPKAIIDFPLNPSILKVSDFKFPLLDIFCEREDFTAISLIKSGVRREFVASWILPPLTARQYNRLYPFFGIAAKATEAYFLQGYDPKGGSTSFWQAAGLSYGSMHSVEYKPYIGFDKDGKNAFFPSMQIRFSFVERNEYVAANYEPLSNLYIEADLHDGYNVSYPIVNFIDGYAYPNLSLSSISPVSGSSAGGTWINIFGQGFSNKSIQQANQIVICGCQAASFAILSPSVLRITTSPAISPGIGDVSVSDTFGDRVVLANAFTYI